MGQQGSQFLIYVLNFQVHKRKENQLQQQNSITETISVQPILEQALLQRETKRQFQISIPLVHALLGTPLQHGCLLPLQSLLWQYRGLAHIPFKKMFIFSQL